MATNGGGGTLKHDSSLHHEDWLQPPPATRCSQIGDYPSVDGQSLRRATSFSTFDATGFKHSVFTRTETADFSAAMAGFLTGCKQKASVESMQKCYGNMATEGGTREGEREGETEETNRDGEEYAGVISQHRTQEGISNFYTGIMVLQ